MSRFRFLLVSVLAVAMLAADPAAPARAESDVIASIGADDARMVRDKCWGVVNGRLVERGRAYQVVEQRPGDFSWSYFRSLYGTDWRYRLGSGGYTASPYYQGHLSYDDDYCNWRRGVPDPTPVGDINDRHRTLERLRHGSGCLDGNRCLLFQGYPTPDCAVSACKSDRLEVRLAGPPKASNPNTMELGEWRYLRFGVRFHPNGRPPSGTLISQVWQDGAGKPPPFRIEAEQDTRDPDRIVVSFQRRADPNRPYIVFHETVVRKDEWHTFHVQMQANPAGADHRGVILVWKDRADTQLTASSADNYDRQQVNRWKFWWGYDPARYPGTSDRLDVRVGLYRPPSSRSTTFWMDRVKLTSRKSSMPGL